MDPLTALSFACNVLQLVDGAIRCGRVVHKLHKDGFTDDHEDLEVVANNMEAIVTGLQNVTNTSNVRKSTLDPQITSLLARSTKLCASLRSLILRCQPGTKGSWRSASAAAFRQLVHKSEIESLEKDLETCRTSLATVLSAETQYDMASHPVSKKVFC